MKLFFDENFPPDLVEGLRLLRFEVDSTHRHGLQRQGLSDLAVLELARALRCDVIVRRDVDFHEQDALAQAIVSYGMAVVAVVFPQSYDTWEVIRDATLLLIERIEAELRTHGPYVRCRVRRPRGRMSRPQLSFSSPRRRR